MKTLFGLYISLTTCVIAIPTICVSVASLIIADQHNNITCESQSYITLSQWLTTNGILGQMSSKTKMYTM